MFKVVGSQGTLFGRKKMAPIFCFERAQEKVWRAIRVYVDPDHMVHSLGFFDVLKRAFTRREITCRHILVQTIIDVVTLLLESLGGVLCIFLWTLIVGATVIGSIGGAIAGEKKTRGCIFDIVAGLVGASIGQALFGTWGTTDCWNGNCSCHYRSGHFCRCCFVLLGT